MYTGLVQRWPEITEIDYGRAARSLSWPDADCFAPRLLNGRRNSTRPLASAAIDDCDPAAAAAAAAAITVAGQRQSLCRRSQTAAAAYRPKTARRPGCRSDCLATTRLHAPLLPDQQDSSTRTPINTRNVIRKVNEKLALHDGNKTTCFQRL